jgi:hypothetical protein
VAASLDRTAERGRASTRCCSGRTCWIGCRSARRGQGCSARGRSGHGPHRHLRLLLKRPPRRKKAVALEGPKVIRRKVSEVASPANPTPVTPASEVRRSATGTARKPGRSSSVPEGNDIKPQGK